MSKGNSGLFSGTMGVAVNSTYLTGSSDVESYSDRGIDIPEHIKEHLAHLQNKGDYITGSVGAFSMSDVSIMSKETGVEFAHVTIGDTTYLIRGDVKGTVIPYDLFDKMKKKGGRWDFHSHPFNGDCIPSQGDTAAFAAIKKYTGQEYSEIVTPDGIISKFNENGLIEKTTVSNKMSDEYKRYLIDLFGGTWNDKYI